MEEQDHLKALTDIRSMMERSSRFISLSGLSGIFAGVFALIGAWMATKVINDHYYDRSLGGDDTGLIMDLVYIALAVLVLSVSAGVILTVRNSRKKGISIWDNTAKRLLANLMIPLATGGIFCMILIYRGEITLVVPCTLIFYGLGLINASKYTFNDIRYLGVCEIILGLTSTLFYFSYSIVFWAIGFGFLHIIYGALMYMKYERK